MTAGEDVAGLERCSRRRIAGRGESRRGVVDRIREVAACLDGIGYQRPGEALLVLKLRQALLVEARVTHVLHDGDQPPEQDRAMPTVTMSSTRVKPPCWRGDRMREMA